MNDPRFPRIRPLSGLVPFNSPRVQPVAPPGTLDLPNTGGAGYTGPEIPSDAPNVYTPNVVYNPANYATVVEGNFPVPDVTSANPQSTQIIQKPAGLRNMLAVRNTSAVATVFIGFGVAATPVSTFTLLAGQFMLLDTTVPQDDVWVLASGPNGTVSVAYSNIPKAYGQT